MLQGPPAVAVYDDSLAAFGLVLDDAAPPPPPELELWAELWPAVRVWLDVCSQWRTGPGGPIALDHTALPPHARPGHGGRRGRRLFNELLSMEAEALAWFAEQRSKPGR